MALVTVETSPDPHPITLVLAGILRRSAADPELARIMQDLGGVLGLQSTTDPQRATIRFANGVVRVENGLDADADVVIMTDFSAPTGPNAPKPGLRETLGLARAAARRPLFAQAAAKVLEPPLPDWRAGAEPFWSVCCRRDPRPHALKIVCTDEHGAGAGDVDDGGDAGVLLMTRPGAGPAPDAPVELHGAGRLLARCFVGETVIGEAVLAGSLQVRGSLADLSLLTGAGLVVMLGD